MMMIIITSNQYTVVGSRSSLPIISPFSVFIGSNTFVFFFFFWIFQRPLSICVIRMFYSEMLLFIINCFKLWNYYSVFHHLFLFHFFWVIITVFTVHVYVVGYYVFLYRISIPGIYFGFIWSNGLTRKYNNGCSS